MRGPLQRDVARSALLPVTLPFQQRMYTRATAEQLEAVLASSGDDVRVLKSLRKELSGRTTRAARALLKRVNARLAAAAGAAASTPVAIGALGGDGEWSDDPVQASIITGPVDARVIVNAPPGTGKTAVACRRIAHLLDQGIPPHQIWLLSFTRTAIRELRNRIAGLAEHSAAVYGVRVSTLDSRAWQMVQGFDSTPLADRVGGHEATIEQALAVLQSGHDAVCEMLDEIAHIVVDEAQDLVGVRADFVLELIRRLPSSTGVTVLTDDAQAIYGFSECESVSGESGTLPERLRGMPGNAFGELELSTVYRTTSTTLATLYIEGRRQVLAAIAAGRPDPVAAARTCIDRWNDGAALPPKDETPDVDTLCVYRSRIEALEAASWLGSDGAPFRLRMSRMPAVVHPWVGLALWDFTADWLTRDELRQRWPRVRESLGMHAPEVDACWEHIVRCTDSDHRVSMDLLRGTLSRPRPPIEFMTDELGLSGPILGTIHASKGREARHVHLWLPTEEDDIENSAEEARVLFVGATRARETLRVGRSDGGRFGRLNSERNYKRISAHKGNPRVRFEVGLEHDVVRHSAVSALINAAPSVTQSVQRQLRETALAVVALRAWSNGTKDDRRYLLRLGEEVSNPVVATLSNDVTRGLYEIRRRLAAPTGDWLKMPTWLGPLFQCAVATVVASVDDPELQHVHDPWRQSGIWLAPVVVGLPTVPFFHVGNANHE